ncbi:oligoribonuclease [Dongshaea marina]|uniref:oligoribonuclease n=1 Tax=Dongshaea marina TaxID=2047966 RepID=UPI000D3E8CCC|nr:oligoribonuclease [Dongshaea marina]
MSCKEKNLIWLDMEMTGLDPDIHHVLEIATIVTDLDLNILAEGPVIAVHQPEEVLQEMDEWNTRTHGASGLIQRVRESKLDEKMAAAETEKFLNKWVKRASSPMCGNTIGQDRRFMHRHMPELERFFHYRNVDVSSIKELVRRWKPEVLDGLVKKGTHQALDDIRESIEELKYYRKHIFTI